MTYTLLIVILMGGQLTSAAIPGFTDKAQCEADAKLVSLEWQDPQYFNKAHTLCLPVQ